MKVNKKIFICALLVLIMLCVVSTASATEPLNENLNATDTSGVIDDDINEELSVQDSEGELSDAGNTITVDCNGGGDYTTISAAVGAATGGETILIKNGEYTEPRIIDVDKKLSFVGESQDGVIIKSSDTKGFFYTSKSNYELFSFSKLTFKDINAGNIGTLFIGGDGNVKITDCTFDNCKSKYGAIRIYTSGIVNIENSKFINCNSTSTSGASAIDLAGGGTEPWTIKNVYVENSQAPNNNMGVVYLDSTSHDFIIDNITIINSSGNVLAAVYTKGNLNIANSTIVNNNFSRENCGILYIGGNKKTINAQANRIESNNADYIITANIESYMNLNYNNIQNNTYKNSFVVSATTAPTCNLDANYWGSNSLPEGVTASTWIIEGNGNYKYNNGTELDVIIPGLNDGAEPIDAIYVSTDGNDANDGSIDSPVFNITKAIELAKAGSGNIIIKAGTYSQNGIVIDGDLTITIAGEGNVVINGIGLEKASIFTINNNSNVTFKNIKFANNQPSRHGGAIFMEGNGETDLLDVNVTVEKCTFDNLEATRGSAIYANLVKGNLLITDSYFINSRASAWGAIAVVKSTYGGGLNVEIKKSKFLNNSASNGGALYLQTSKVNIEGSEFCNNVAENSPGAISLTNCNATISDCSIYNNRASKDAAAIAINAGQILSQPTTYVPSNVVMANCVIENNTATQKAPAILVLNSNLNISYSVIDNEFNINNTVVSNYNNDEPGNLTANNNWWGTNEPTDTVDGKNIAIGKWVILNVEANVTQIIKYDTVKLTVDFNHVNTTSGVIEELTGGVIPKDSYDVEFSVENGIITPSSVVVQKGMTSSVEYEVGDVADIVTARCGEAITNVIFDAGVEPYYGVIYLSKDGDDANNGSKEAPVATLDKAISLALNKHGSGQLIIGEGTYSGTDYKINRNLTVIGEGKVIIDGNNQQTSIFNIASDANVDKLELINLTVINVNRGYGAFVYNYGANEVIMDNITFVGNTNTNVRFITTNKGSLTIKNAVMSNNTLGGIICHSGSGNLTIVNSTFENNLVNKDSGVYALVYFSSGSGEIIIEDCVFKNNTVKQNVVYSTTGNDIYMKNTEITDTISEVGSGAAIRAQAKLNVENSTFINNKASKDGGAIYIDSNGVATITQSVFINNVAGSSYKGNSIANKGRLTVNYSILISDSRNYVVYNAGEYGANAQYNWWGTNDNPRSLNGKGSYFDYDEWDDVDSEEVDSSNWVVMTVKTDMVRDFINPGDNVTITVDFTNYNDSEKLNKLNDLIPELEVSAKALNGQLDSQNKVTKDNICEFNYNAVNTGVDTINITSANAIVTITVDVMPPYEGIIYVSTDGDDANEGSVEYPVKSLERAIRINKMGQIIILPGTYKTGYLGIIDTDLNISGEGKVIIDADNNNRILYIYNTSNVVLKNLIFTNGYTTEALDESGAILGSAGNLTIENCTFANSKSEKNGGAIYNAGNLIVIGCTFENNTADECGGAIFTQSAGIGITPTLTVSNSIFTNNTAKGRSNFGGGAIYVQQAADGVSIVNSIFENNKCIDYGGGAVEIAQTNVALIDNCTFISNSANGENEKTRSNYGGGAVSFKGYYDSVRETLTITNSLFLDNKANEYGGGAVFAMYSTVNVQSSVLINNGDDHGIYVYGRDADIAPAKVNANDNWWGSNDNPKQFINRGTISRWAILTVSNSSEIRTGENVELTVSINNYTTGSSNGTLTNPIKVERPVTIYTNLGNIEGTLVNGEFTTDYAVPAGLKIISATVDSETQVLLVISTQTTIKADNITGAMGDRVDYTVNLTTEDNSIINTGNVEVYFGDDLVATIPVMNNQAIATLMISKPTGEYPITVKYIDETQEFVAGDATAALNVTGINNVVTPETFGKFFDSEGKLLSDIPFDEIIFKGTFNDMGVLTINKAIRITGENALFNDTVFSIDADGVELNNVEILLNKRFADVDGAAIYVGGNNAVISKSNITYNAPDNVESYAIFVDIASGVKIIDNNIKYCARSEGDVKTIPVNVYRGNGLVFENNCLEASLPSGPMDYQTYDFKSKAVCIVFSDDASVKNNTIRINYTTFSGAYDTIYGVHIATSDNVNVSDNEISLDSHNLGYGLVMDGKNLKITNNTINVSSEDYLAHGLDIQLDSTAVVDGNDITATSRQVVYPIDIEDWGTNAGNVVVTNNNIRGESNTVYGIYAQLNKTTISNNNIEVNGNYTIGITSYQTDLIADNNKIVSNGSNIGEALSPQSSVPVETTGICAAEGTIQITNNDIKSTGNSTIDAINTTGSIKSNKLVAANGEGDATISAKNSNLVIDNKKPVEPTKPVIKLTGKNVAMYYADSAKYQVLVTIDGKAAKGVKVSFTFNGKTKTVQTNSKGYAIFTIKNNKLTPKKYTITAKYGGKVVKNTITVKQILKSSNKKVKKSAKKLVLKATLKKGKKAIKGKKVTFKFKGKKYTAKTNKKGVAKVTIKKKVIKKLKKGKKYAFTVTYLKDTIKKSVKVKK